jgi:transglutaminase/protease-like cytokinesis protein 3
MLNFVYFNTNLINFINKSYINLKDKQIIIQDHTIVNKDNLEFCIIEPSNIF